MAKRKAQAAPAAEPTPALEVTPTAPVTPDQDGPLEVKPAEQITRRLEAMNSIAGNLDAERLRDAGIEPEPTPDEPPVQVENADDVAELEAAPAAKTRIKVDGQEIEVDDQQVREAGIRALQKESAADRRLQEATAKLTEAKALLTRAQQTGAPPAPESPPPGPAPDAEAIAHAIQFGDADEVKKAVSQLLTMQTPERREAIPSVEQITAMVENRLSFTSAIQQFQKDNQDLWTDPYLRQLVFNEDDRLQKEIIDGLRDPITYSERFTEAGKAVRTWLETFKTPSAPPINPARQARKAEAAGSVPTAAGGRAPVAPAAPVVPTEPSDIIAGMRQARGQA